jgi:ubiquinone/menaquinone biosynthesis C-methylase UbiE
MKQELMKKCQICQNETFELYLNCKDHLVTAQGFSIQSCKNCGFRFTNPRPSTTTIGNYYQSLDYVSHNDQSSGVINSIYRLVRNYTLKRKLALLNSVSKKKGKLLDVGCGTGLLLYTCKKGGWSIQGTEPDVNARSVASSRLQQTIVPTIEEITDKDFDVITMWHVLEHVPNLQKTLHELNSRLKRGGMLVLALPNSDSVDAKQYKEFWAAYDVPRHLSHFTPSTIDKLVTKSGFSLEETHPMYFDAFYISMLSTKYRDGKTNWLESIYQGFRSNIKASQSGDYSSLIYIFKKM